MPVPPQFPHCQGSAHMPTLDTANIIGIDYLQMVLRKTDIHFTPLRSIEYPIIQTQI